MSNVVIIVGGAITPKRKEKLFTTHGEIRSLTRGRGSKSTTTRPPAAPMLFTVKGASYIGFAVMDTEGASGIGMAASTVHFRNDIISIDENPSQKFSIEKKLNGPLKAAQTRWEEFALWAWHHGFDFGAGELFLLAIPD